MIASDTTGISLELTRAFCESRFDLSQRRGAPPVGWASMPECVADQAVREAGADDATARIFLTLVSALDRARDADRLWLAAARTFREQRWVFDPAEVTHRPHLELLDALRKHGVSQRHTVDAAAWRTISENLYRPELAGTIHDVIYAGNGSVAALRKALATETPAGTPLFPMLRGPKVARMWIRMLVVPGRAQIEGIAELEVAVDVQVQKVTEYLGLTNTHGSPVEKVRDVIQHAWAQEIALHGAEGPPPLHGTAAALDPAIWFFGKWGCTFCERAGSKLPIHSLCRKCLFDELRIRSSS